MRKIPLTVLLSALTLFVAVGPVPLAWLEYNRAALAHGEFWRLMTCHFTHWSGEHLFWDLLVFAIAGCACERLNRRVFLCVLGAAMVTIPLGVFVWEPAVFLYRGLSGIDAALYVLLCVLLGYECMRQQKRVRGTVIFGYLVVFFAKLVFETMTGQTVYVEAGASFRPIALAHWMGAAAGMAPALVRRPQWTRW
jgi:rhomboid family GlyGly-CTERM serine protease